MIFKRMMIVPRIAFILMFLLPAGCAKRQVVAEEPPTMAETGSALAMERYASKAESPAPALADQAAQPAQRLRHHNGSIKMRAAKPAEVLDQAAAQAKKAGGYVESLDGNRVVLRIPSARFQEIFDGLLTLGDVLEKSITVQDITEQYTDVDLRLQIAQATRRRMLELLAKAKNEKEKLAILKEVERLSTEIEYLTTRRDTLLKMAQFARLTLEVQEREFNQGRAGVQIRAFDWIAKLSPFEKSVAILGDELKLEPPSGFVVLENIPPWAAESADGVAVWASRQTNVPAGDTSFWLEAVRQRLEPEFTSAKVVSAGGFRALRLVGRGQNTYVYLVALRAQREQGKFDLVEIYFPSREHETRHGAAVLDILAKGDK